MCTAANGSHDLHGAVWLTSHLQVCYPLFTNRADYWNPNTLQYRFVAEAKRLWELEADEPRLSTIQAGVIFNVYYNLCGLDKIGQAYRIKAITLAQQIQLFDCTVNKLGARVRDRWAYTAWALFNWET